jgi:hypothetical protein
MTLGSDFLNGTVQHGRAGAFGCNFIPHVITSALYCLPCGHRAYDLSLLEAHS